MYGWILEILQCRKPVPSEVVKLVKMAVWAAKAERILGTGVTVLAWVKTSRAHATCTVLESHGSGRRHASELRDFTRTQVESFSGGVRSGGTEKMRGEKLAGWKPSPITYLDTDSHLAGGEGEGMGRAARGLYTSPSSQDQLCSSKKNLSSSSLSP